MSVSTQDSRFVYTGNGSSTDYSFPRKFITGTLRCFINRIETSAFSVAGVNLTNGVYQSGTVTFSTAPASGATVTIWRDPDLVAELALTGGGTFDTLNRDADKDALKDQALLDRISRAPMAPVDASTSFDGTIGETLTGKGGWLVGLKETLNGYELIEPESSSSTSVTPSGASGGRTLANWFADVVNVKANWGAGAAVGDGVTDDRAAIQAAIDAADTLNKPVYFPAGTYLVNKNGSTTYALEWKSGVILQGAGDFATTIKLANSQNCNVIESTDATAFIAGSFGAGDQYSGIEGGAIRDLKIDGNWTNQTAGSGIVFYGDEVELTHIQIKNCKEHFIKSAWGQFGEENMESTFENIQCDTCGKDGIWFEGPHDSDWRNVIMVDAGQDADDTYDGFHVEGFGSGRFYNVHSWHRSTATNRMRYAGYFDAFGCHIVACLWEGARQCLFIDGQGNSICGGDAFGNFSDDPMVILRGSNHKMDLRIVNRTGQNATCVGIGDGTEGLYGSYLNLHCITTATNAVTITDDDGENFAIIATDGSTNAYTGSPAASTVLLVKQPAGGVEVAGNFTILSGLRVGFAGAPTDNRIALGDATFYLDWGGGTTPNITFDTGDTLFFVRASNQWEFWVGGAAQLAVRTGLIGPTANDGVALGAAAFGFSDAFFATGAVLGFGNGNYSMTHSSALMTFSGGVTVTGALTSTATPIGNYETSITGVNFNSANTDNAITITLPPGYTRYRVTNVIIHHASASITTATCGVFTDAAAGGTAIVASGSAITVNTASEGTNNNMQGLSIVNGGTTSFNDTSIFFRVQTPQGSAATADVTINYQALP